MSKKSLEEQLRCLDNKISDTIKTWLEVQETSIEKKFFNKGLEGSFAYSDSMDEVITGLYLTSPNALPKKEVALVALGGYGRKELNIRSDIDLMLLYEGTITPEIKELTDRMIYTLWDTGVDLAFSIRSIKDCIELGKTDLKTLTSFLDSRLIYGSDNLVKDLKTQVGKKFFTPSKASKFIKEKLEESESRQNRFGGSVYILEPNIKEGEGGLRDIHTARWLAMARNDLMYNPIKAGLLKKDENEDLETSFDFLLKVRNALHQYSGKKNDQLTFDAQTHLSKIFKYKTTETSLSIEKFMEDYFKHATNIKIYSARMISRLMDKEEKANKKFNIWPLKTKQSDVKIDENFVFSKGKIVATNKDVFKDDHLNIIRIFQYFQQYNATLERNTKDLLLSNINKVNAKFREDKNCADIFLDILRNKNLFWTLTEMHRTRFLDNYIPEFADIRGKMQHDMYHVYTVDAHTLFAVRELERLKSSKEYKENYPMAVEMISEIDDMAPLVLGVMFHDIGKALGKGHAEKGARLVPIICGRLHMKEDTIALVEFLVLKHLILANTAQYRDIYDDKLIIDFSKNVGREDRLKNLFLLTFADVRAVGPEVWTEWKGSLFHELYLKSLTMLKRGTFESEGTEKIVQGIKEEVIELKPEQKENIEKYFKLLPSRYYQSSPVKAIIREMGLIEKAQVDGTVINITQVKRKKITKLTVATSDIHSLFAMITGVMAANNVNILDAKINTLKNGMALDILELNDFNGDFITDERKLERLDRELRDVITGQVNLDILIKKNGPSILDRRVIPNIKPSVIIDNECSDDYTVIDMRTEDRVGLLFEIAKALVDLGLTIHIAKISTKGAEAADIFYVTDIFGQKIYFDEKLNKIVETLFDTIKTQEQKSA